jgi:hypothetical protein
MFGKNKNNAKKVEPQLKLYCIETGRGVRPPFDTLQAFYL